MLSPALMWNNCIKIVCIIVLSQKLHASTCPLDKESWKKRETVFMCIDFTYHCGISVHDKEIEFCALPMYMRKGFCPLFDTSKNLNIVEKKCIHHDGCPIEGYFTNELYKYHSCLNIFLELSVTRMQNVNESTITQNNSNVTKVCSEETSQNSQQLTSKFVQMTLNVYSTTSKPKEIYLERLIILFVVSGTSAVANALIAIWLIMFNRCEERPFTADVASQAGEAISSRATGFASVFHGFVNVQCDTLMLVPYLCDTSYRFVKRQVLKRELGHSRMVTVVELEDNIEYCEVSELDLLEQRSPDTDIIRQDGYEEDVNGKTNYNRDENDIHTIIDNYEHNTEQIDDKKDDTGDDDISRRDDIRTFEEAGDRDN